MSDATPILHMLSPQKHMSPFDVNMAADAGYKVIIPYINVTLEETTALVQDAIFSRPPDYGVRTGVFIGGKDAIVADLFDLARGTVSGRRAPDEITFFKSVGAAIEDLAAAIAVMEAAKP